MVILHFFYSWIYCTSHSDTMASVCIYIWPLPVVLNLNFESSTFISWEWFCLQRIGICPVGSQNMCQTLTALGSFRILGWPQDGHETPLPPPVCSSWWGSSVIAHTLALSSFLTHSLWHIHIILRLSKFSTINKNVWFSMTVNNRWSKPVTEARHSCYLQFSTQTDICLTVNGFKLNCHAVSCWVSAT